jgi:hypothetical protein
MNVIFFNSLSYLDSSEIIINFLSQENYKSKKLNLITAMIQSYTSYLKRNIWIAVLSIFD